MLAKQNDPDIFTSESLCFIVLGEKTPTSRNESE